MNARLTKIEKGLSAVRQELDGVETRLRVLIEESRAETRTLFDGLGAMIERLERRLKEMNRTGKTADTDRGKVLADHARRISALECRR